MCRLPASRAVSRVAAAVFWLSAVLLVWTQALYGPFLALLRRLRRRSRPRPGGADLPQVVTLIVAAYREEAVIAAKVANALALDWPRERLEVVVAVDGGAADADAPSRARAPAGADRVLELPRSGKVRAQDAAVRGRPRRAARVLGRQRALGAGRAARAASAASRIPRSATRAGSVRFVADGRTNQEGLYWRYEMWLRAHESALARSPRATARSTRCGGRPTSSWTR